MVTFHCFGTVRLVEFQLLGIVPDYFFQTNFEHLYGIIIVESLTNVDMACPL